MSEHLVDTPPLTKKDFTSDQLVRWCPGCGDYAILSAIQKAMPELGLPKEKFAFVSGIGCAARFPYYMNTYGFHTIHGRAPAVATGLKLANPDLNVWIVTGDGDSMAIGGNHFIHAIRRNVDLNILLFNNEIYGLTKGQYSPTSKTGLRTKSTPLGSAETPFSAGELALGAKGTFFARTIDTNPKLMTQVFVESSKHKGTSLIEILQNCVIYNDKTHGEVTSRETAADHQLHLEHGKPMIFGKESNKGICLNGLKLEIVTIGENGITENDILVHDAHEPDPTLHNMLVRMMLPEFPVALGIIRQVEGLTYGDMMEKQAEGAKSSAKINSMDELISSGNTWVVD
ncbi:MAG: 2-oxoacid:ferredoxin oxidoreductase subunit beta [Flavobacteriales bacterium]|nr:2-oxoacid:ferredoxin oxidoreductase subunit beta [Bacteroidales bacterium AH-315-I05]PCJ84053.1 MAG: 2-oxoacid:ferredoxin oxidoreductase subunit beta [Flavobacteriales bacterium]